MDIRFKLRPTKNFTAETRAQLMAIVSAGYQEFTQARQVRMNDSPFLETLSSKYLAKLVPMMACDINDVAVSKLKARFFVLQKFNTKYKNVTLVDKPGKKVIDATLLQKSHWEATVYDVDVGVLQHLGICIVQHARHFTVHSL